MRSVALALSLAVGLAGAPLFAEDAILGAVRSHLGFLAGDGLGGRRAGGEGARAAAQYLLERFEEMGLEASFEEVGGGRYRNVVATIPGSSGRYILLGAHYDGLGRRGGKVYNGADDDASGVAALLEAGRLLAGARLEDGVILAAFDAEEIGLVGSRALALGRGAEVELMISVDMVGHLRDEGRLIYEGAATIEDGEALLRGVEVPGVTLRCRPRAEDSFVLTDNFHFDRLGIPALTVTTGLETSRYHRPDDDVAMLDVEGVALVARHLAGVVLALQGRVVPTGARLYGGRGSLAYGYYGFSADASRGEAGEGEAGRSLCLGFEQTFPLGRGMGGEYRLSLGLQLDYAAARSGGGARELVGATVPAGLVLGLSRPDVEMNAHYGAYYRFWAPLGDALGDTIMDPGAHELGLCVGLDILLGLGLSRPRSIGLGIQTFAGWRGIEGADLAQATRTRQLVVKMVFGL